MDSQNLLAVPLLVVALTLPSPAAARQAPATKALAPIVKAEQALQKGEFEDAADAARDVLRGTPGDRRAATVLVTALARSDDVDGAYEAYDQHVKQTKAEDATLLAPVAEATLRQLSSERSNEISADALAALAARGDAASLDRLKSLAQPKPPAQPSVLAVAALAGLGDAASRNALAGYLAEPAPGPRITALRVLGTSAPATLVPLLDGPLADPNPLVRVAAIEAAAAAGAKTLIPALKQAMTERDGLVRLHAAAALHRLGDPGGKEALDAAFATGLPDAAVIAASAFAGSRDRSWVPRLVPVLKNENTLMAVRAAALLVPTTERAAALATLRTALQDPSPVVRDEAAAHLADAAAGDLALLRPMLKDPSAVVRLRASTAVLKGPAPGQAVNGPGREPLKH